MKPAKSNPYTLALTSLTFADEGTLRQAIFDTARAQVGLRERTNRNDHPKIALYNKSLGLPERAYYCASGLYWCHLRNGVKLPIASPGSVASWFANSKRIVYRRSTRGNQRVGQKPMLMDGVSLFASHIEGFAQTRWDPEAESIDCIGFNTGGTNGIGGVYKTRRRMREIKLIVNQISPYWQARP
ncbi:hypothetical protein [Larkinella terrae]|uniref:Uncharacterized protein n=1 Tax=Larkinella terrae TaxID=2025311 RepID=A0A7K0EJC1_9BACT|nr:hypothetical protein [Larkinella terrae]MRS61884.1 hypothetical protein [Larkinella terrae]